MDSNNLTSEEKILKDKVWDYIIDKKRESATEELAKHIYENEFIYTTRDDENSEVWIYKNGIYIPQGKTYIKEFCRKILGVAYTTTLINQVISKVEADTFIDQDKFFNNIIKEEICVENGILNLKTRELSEWDAEKIFFTKIPVTYDPQAVCPNIETHFKKRVSFYKLLLALFD